MTVELRPLGVNCNLQCQYCYQHPQRDAGNAARPYDMEKMKAGVLAEGGPFNLFGGEALLVPKPDLEELWAWGLEQFGRNTMQTNATLIDDDHIAMFRRYKVHVGVSMDGPGALNDTRWYGTLERTRAATERSQAALDRLCREGLRPSMILTLHGRNAAPQHLPELLEWVRGLVARGLGSMRVHLLESETDVVRQSYGLSDEENIAAMRAFLALSRTLPEFRIQPFSDMRKMLMGDDARTTCTWNGCDPYNTKAVQGVEGDGQRSNCGRTNKDGIDFEKSSRRGMERSLALYLTPQSDGGCKDCRFFLMCKGQCPGTSIDRDWRNRSEHCEVWKALFDDFEQELIGAGRTPLSRSPRRVPIERELVGAWERGTELKIVRVARRGSRQGDATRPRHATRVTTKAAAEVERVFEDELGFLLPSFSRVAWVNARARETWEGRLQRIERAWKQAEWRSVSDGVRACAQLRGPVARLDARTVQAVLASDLKLAEVAGGTVIGRERDLAAFAEASARRDEDAIGALLGYPSCCRESYTHFHVVQRLPDPTWPMAVQSRADAELASHRDFVSDGRRSLTVGGGVETNTLWRALGVRGAPHVPCSFGCEATVELGRRMQDVLRRAGFEAELAWLQVVLDWPVEWSALHGIAETKTPVLKLANRTHATAERYVVRRLGGSYPAEGVRGVRFPYRRGRLRVTASSAFERGLNHAAAGRADVRTGSVAG
jgi:uncharacterized protein